MEKEKAEYVHEYIFGSEYYANWEKELVMRRLMGDISSEGFVKEFDYMLESASQQMEEDLQNA